MSLCRRWSSQNSHRGEGAPLLREGPCELVGVEVPAAVFEKENRRGWRKGKGSSERMKSGGGEGQSHRVLGLWVRGGGAHRSVSKLRELHCCGRVPMNLLLLKFLRHYSKKKTDEGTKGKESKERMKCRGGEGKIIRCMGLWLGKTRLSSQQCQRGEGAPLRREGPC